MSMKSLKITRGEMIGWLENEKNQAWNEEEDIQMIEAIIEALQQKP